MFVTIYIYCYVRPDNQYHAHSHCVRTLTLIPDIAQRKPITLETESERERDCTQRFIKDKYKLFISTSAALLRRYLSAYNKDVASNQVATLRSVQSRIANIFCVMICVMICVIGEQQKSTTANSVDQPSLSFNVLYSI